MLSIAEVWSMLHYNQLLSGITLSGGEPLAQAAGALALAKKVKEVGGNLVIYTGYQWEKLITSKTPEIKEILDLTTLLIDGPFKIEEKADYLLFRGSRNQRIIDVQSSLGRKNPVLWKKSED